MGVVVDSGHLEAVVVDWFLVDRGQEADVVEEAMHPLVVG